MSGTSSEDVWAVTESGVVTRLTHRMPTLPGETCERPLPIFCQSTTTGSVAGAEPGRDRYACDTRVEEGGEVVYRLENPVSGRVTVRLTPRGGDLDLIAVAADDRDDCDLDSCLGSGQTPGDVIESVTLDAVQGETLFFVVDSPAPSSQGYTLEVQCDKR